jgi:hypothetical protein
MKRRLLETPIEVIGAVSIWTAVAVVAVLIYFTS